MERWEQNPQGLKDELDKRNLRLETVSNGGRMRVNFIDPRERAGTIEDHMKLVSFIRRFECDHRRLTAAAGQRISTGAGPSIAGKWPSPSTRSASA